MIEYASSLGYYTLLDAAALAPSSSFSLSDHPQLDAMAVSFYKMFGFPTGVGALIVKESFLAQLSRPWFAGGNVDVVQVPGTLVTRSYEIHEQFEVMSKSIFVFWPCSLTCLRICTGWHNQLSHPTGYYGWTSLSLNIFTFSSPSSFISSAFSHFIAVSATARKIRNPHRTNFI